jgi:hypothetical protein
MITRIKDREKLKTHSESVEILTGQEKRRKRRALERKMNKRK